MRKKATVLLCLYRRLSRALTNAAPTFWLMKKIWFEMEACLVNQVSMATNRLCGITKSAMQLAVHDVYVYFQFQNGSPAVVSVTLIDNSCSDALVCTAAIAREQTPNLSQPCRETFFVLFFFNQTFRAVIQSRPLETRISWYSLDIENNQLWKGKPVIFPFISSSSWIGLATLDSFGELKRPWIVIKKAFVHR